MVSSVVPFCSMIKFTFRVGAAFICLFLWHLLCFLVGGFVGRYVQYRPLCPCINGCSVVSDRSKLVLHHRLADYFYHTGEVLILVAIHSGVCCYLVGNELSV